MASSPAVALCVRRVAGPASRCSQCHEPALGLSTDTGVISFCFIAIGYLAILIAEAWTRQRGGLAGYPLGGRYRIGNALQGLREEAGDFDVMYCDVDKDGYPDCWRAARDRIRIGGLSENSTPYALTFCPSSVTS
jgi:hypothetical protein